MQMTNEEIIRDYKLANNKSSQIAILADLNCCSKEDIKKILQEGGIELQKRTKSAPKKKIAPTKPVKVQEEDDCVEELEEIIEEFPEDVENTHLPKSVRIILEERLTVIEDVIRDCQSEYQEIVNFLKRMV